MTFFKVQSWRHVDLAWVIWTGWKVSASEGTGTTHLLMWWLCLSFPVLGLPSSLQKVEVCKEDCGRISKYYLKDSLLIWWEITLRLLLCFVFINSELGAPVPLPDLTRKEQKRSCWPQGNDGLAVKAARRQDKRSSAKKPHNGVGWGYGQLVAQDCKMSKTKICLTQLPLSHQWQYRCLKTPYGSGQACRAGHCCSPSLQELAADVLSELEVLFLF